MRWVEIRTPKTSVETCPLPYTSPHTIQSSCLVPKRGLDHIKCEIARVILLHTNGSIVPVSNTVPRKNYLDFQTDLFPDTWGDEYGLSVEEWQAGKSQCRPLVSVLSLLAEKTEVEPLAKLDNIKEVLKTLPTHTLEKKVESDASSKIIETFAIEETINNHIKKDTKEEPVKEPPVLSFLPKHSSYRHVFVESKTVFDSLLNLNSNISPESNGFECNNVFLAFPMSGPGGRVAVIERAKQGRLAPKIPCLVNG